MNKENKGLIQTRNWGDLQNDEIYAIWNQYLKFEGFSNGDPLCLDRIKSRPMRLTLIEIVRLVDELLKRLEIRENDS